MKEIMNLKRFIPKINLWVFLINILSVVVAMVIAQIILGLFGCSVNLMIYTSFFICLYMVNLILLQYKILPDLRRVSVIHRLLLSLIIIGFGLVCGLIYNLLIC